MTAEASPMGLGPSWQPCAIAWRDAEAPLALADALGQIAADMWLAGRVTLTADHVVATLSTDAEAATDQDRDGQAPGDGVGCEAVA